MAATNLSDAPTSRQPRWYAPTPAKFLLPILVMQGVLFLSAHYRWFWFNERKGWTVLITVAATAACLVLAIVWGVIGRFVRAKRPSQFSLATLLLLVPVIAIPCGWLAREMDHTRRQIEIVATAKKVGYLRDVASRDWIARALGQDFFRDVDELELRHDLANDSDVEKIKLLTQLKVLNLCGSQATDAALADIGEMKQLTSLDISSTQITDAGLVKLRGLPELTHLDISGTQITDKGLVNLRGMTKLTFLSLGLTDVADAGLEHLSGLGNLKLLYLNANDEVTDAGLKHLEELPHLEFLILHSSRVTDAGVDHLEKLKSLRLLAIGGTQVTDEGERRLREALPTCEIHAR